MHHSVSNQPVSTTNAIAGIASFFIPGLGQIIQGRLLSAMVYFAIEAFIWYVIFDAVLMLLGLLEGWGSPWCLVLPFISHVAASYEASTYKNS